MILLRWLKQTFCHHHWFICEERSKGRWFQHCCHCHKEEEIG